MLLSSGHLWALSIPASVVSMFWSVGAIVSMFRGEVVNAFVLFVLAGAALAVSCILIAAAREQEKLEDESV